MKREAAESEPDEYFEIFNSLVQSQSEWSQLPEIVNLSLKALGKYLASQAEHQADFKQQLNQLSLVANQLQLNKASKREVERQIEDTRMLLERHYSSPPSEPDERSGSVDYKFRRDEGLDRTMIEEVKTIALALIEERIAQQSQMSQRRIQDQLSNVVSDLRRQLDQTVVRMKDLIVKSKESSPPQEKRSESRETNLEKQVQSDVKRLNEDLKTIRAEMLLLNKNSQQKVDRDLFDEQMKQLRSRPQRQEPQRAPSLEADIEALKKVAEELLVKKLDQKQFADFKHKTSKALTEKVKLQEVEEIVKAFQSDLTNQLNDARSEIRRLEKHLTKQIKSAIESLQASQAQIHKPRKDTSPSSKKTNDSISEIKSSLHRVQRKIHERLLDRESTEHNSLSDVREQLTRQWSRIQQELEDRERKLCETIEQTLQTNRNTVRPSRKTNKDSDTELALAVICKEMVLGKWTCRSAPLVGRMIPWENQLNNTNTECFIWQPQHTSILVESPGLYRLEVGFFSPQRSDLVVLVNGEKVMVVYSKEEQRINRKHPNGCVAGTTAVDIIVMPARGRLAIEVSGANAGEAYLGLWRI